MDFANKVALITGGAGGIGFQSAKELLRNGLKHVAILDLASSPGEELADKLNAEFGKGRAIFVSCDVTKANELEAAFAKTVNEFGGLDIVINNAGILNESKWELTIDINLIAVVRGTMLALQYMGKDKGGKGGVIVNTSSTYGVDPVAWSPAYAAAKAGVVGLSRSYGLSYHYDKTGVRVITMCPSFTETQLLSEADDSRLLLFEDAKVALNEINNGLMQKPENVAKAFVYVIRNGKSGSIWLAEGGDPVREFTPRSIFDKAALICLIGLDIFNFVRGDMQVENKIALVTGGARGIGFAYATELLRNGAAHVAILDLATSPGLEAANKLNVEFGDGRAIFIECDVTKDIEFKAAFVKVIEELGGLDIVINNAGIVNESQYDLTININLTAVVRGTILGLQHMGKDKGGKGGVIVNTSSIYGLDPGPWLPVYGATKHGVVGLSRSFGLPYHYEKTGVKVLAMCPSFTDTKLLNEVGDCTGPFVDKEAAMNDIKSQSLQKPENVGKALVDIISRGNSGSVWISEAGEPVAEIFIPDRFTLVASSRKQPLMRAIADKVGVYEHCKFDNIFTANCPIRTQLESASEGSNLFPKFKIIKDLTFYAKKRIIFVRRYADKKQNCTSHRRSHRNRFCLRNGTVTKWSCAAFVEVIKELGGLDIVINNAGIVNEWRYDLAIDVNLTAVVRGTMLGLQHMGKDKGGKGGVIVNTASIYGLEPSPWSPVYAATKHGVVGLSRSFGLPYYYDNTCVKVLTICPSFTDTRFLKEAGDCLGPFVDAEVAMNDTKSQSIQKPEDVAKALVDIISRGKSGGVWISEAGELVSEVFIPDRFTLMASSRKQH
ncbi:uncharacterized protein [Neodiprion pinetum]|uniref:uncharacterized protein n=1 Tax=Neodiprion pinetum TaxID=441929 RepID=UPI0037136D47